MQDTVAPNIHSAADDVAKPMSCPAVPLLLGVTGPRQIEPGVADEVRKEIDSLLHVLKRNYPNTPLLLLSPLVVGADQLAAMAALSPRASAQLVVVLPWPQSWEIYDEQRHGDKAAYARLLTQAAQVVEMPPAEGVTVERLRNDPDAREIQYAEVGRYIARHSQILLALSDQDERPDSQTATMVRWHRHGADAPYMARVGALDSAKGAAIRHFALTPSDQACAPNAAGLDQLEYPHFEPLPRKEQTRRPSQNLWDRWRVFQAAAAAGLVWLHVQFERLLGRAHTHADLGKHQLQKRWRAIDNFNRDAAQVASRTEQLTTAREYLLSVEKAKEIGPCADRLLDLYARADAVAGDYQKKTQRTVYALFAIAAAAIAALEIYAHAWHVWPVLLVYLVLLGAGYGWFRWPRRREYQGRWLDARAFAETLRVQIYWHIAGCRDCTADHYLRHFRGDLDWIRHAARAAFLCSGGHTASALARNCGEPVERIRLARNNWVVNQRDWFLKTADRHTSSEIVFDMLARLAFLAAIVVAIVHLFLHLSTDHMSHGLILMTFGFLVAAAFLGEYSDIQTFSLTSRKYRWMAELYNDANDKLVGLLHEPADPPPTVEEVAQAEKVLFELGCEALAENADWVVQHRQRPPVLPGG